jgi:ABC-type lipoprotein export system ATPase subunit
VTKRSHDRSQSRIQNVSARAIIGSSLVEYFFLDQGGRVARPHRFLRRGKTTLLNLLAALDQPDAGEILIHGRDIAHLSLWSAASYRRLQVGMIFQCYNLLPQLTTIQNVVLPMMAAGRSDFRAASDLLRSVGLADRIGHRATELSGFEQQRVAIARALANGPSLVLADEPTGNLDEENANLVMGLLACFCKDQEATLIVATHDVQRLRQADRVFVMQSGSLREESLQSFLLNQANGAAAARSEVKVKDVANGF